MWEIEYYEKSNGDCPVNEFLDALPPKLAAKASNPQTDTTALKTEIDWLVCELYKLTPNEIKIVKGVK